MIFSPFWSIVDPEEESVPPRPPGTVAHAGGRGVFSAMRSRTEPRTWGEAVRRLSMHCQTALARTKDPRLSKAEQDYWAAFANRALETLQKAEAQPANAPYAGRMAAAPCSTPGCSGECWVLARELWEQARGRREIPTRLCRDCLSRGRGTRPARSEPPEAKPSPRLSEPLTELLDRIVSLEREIFEDRGAESRVAHALGDWDRAAHRWTLAMDTLDRRLGPEEADRRLAEAREAAGTAGLMQGILEAAAAGTEPAPETQREQIPPPREQDPPAGEQTPPDPVQETDDDTEDDQGEEAWIF